MRAILTRIMAGRFQAISSASLAALLSMLVLPMSYVCGSIIGLATLRNGLREGALVVAGSLLLTGGVMWASFDTPLPAVMMAGVTWVPVWLLCGGLRATSSLSLVLSAAGALAGLAVVVFRLLVGDTAAWWRETWRSVLRAGESLGDSASAAGEVQSQLRTVLDAAAPLMTGVAAALSLLGLITMVLLARWCHAVLDNPGGFGREFRDLALPRQLAAVTAVAAFGVMAAHGALREFALEILMITGTLHFVHGLAVVHAVVRRRGAATGWLVFLYLLLFLIPTPALYVAGVLAFIGMSDGWFGYRERVGGKT